MNESKYKCVFCTINVFFFIFVFVSVKAFGHFRTYCLGKSSIFFLLFSIPLNLVSVFQESSIRNMVYILFFKKIFGRVKVASEVDLMSTTWL